MPSISVTNPELIVSINLGDASHNLDGIINPIYPALPVPSVKE